MSSLSDRLREGSVSSPEPVQEIVIPSENMQTAQTFEVNHYQKKEGV